MPESKEFSGWAVLELMGHRKLGGYVTPISLAGAGMLRVDVPSGEEGVSYYDDGRIVKPDGAREWAATQYYAPSALYYLTPCTADIAVRLAASCKPEPVTRWELPAAKHSAANDPEVGPTGSHQDDHEDDDTNPQGPGDGFWQRVMFDDVDD